MLQKFTDLEKETLLKYADDLENKSKAIRLACQEKLIRSVGCHPGYLTRATLKELLNPTIMFEPQPEIGGPKNIAIIDLTGKIPNRYLATCPEDCKALTELSVYLSAQKSNCVVEIGRITAIPNPKLQDIYPELQVSTGVCGALTFGSGEIDFYGYWEEGNYQAARDYQKLHPEDGECWPYSEETLRKNREESAETV